MNSQLKSRQISSTNPNQSNISQNNLTSKPSSKNQHSVKKFNQVLSQNVTPRKKETSGNVKPKAHKKQASNNYKENEQYQQLFMERKKSQDYHQQQQQHPIISQSTKVSPNRPSNGPINSQIPLQNKFSNKQIQNCYEFKKQQTSNDPSSQYTLRIPYYENDKNHINTISYQNYEIDTITPDIISQTQNMHNQKGIVKKDVSQTIISGGNSIQAADDLGIDSSIHQSFINLIYPSKSKKKLANESAISNSIQASQPQKYSKGGNHQKSKSLFIGVNTLHFAHMLKSTQNMAPNNHHGYNKGVQKVQQSSYKKQASIFNYSQRLKELLDDTSVGGGDESAHHGAPNQKNPFQKHQIFSQQHSPSGHQGKTMISQQEMKLQKSLDKDCKSTFDKIINQKHEYLTINDPQAMNKHQAAHHNQTLDVNLQKHLFNPQQLKTSVTSSNTPSNSSKNMIQNKEIQNSKTHLRKPSQPVNNNYILEVAPSQQQLSFINEYPSQNPQRLSFKPQSNHSTIEVNRQASQEPQKQTSSIHYSLQQQIQFQQSIFQQQQQQQQLSQHREKKQHQPTQSKIVNKQFNNSQLCGQSVGTSSGAIGHHQRSQSDYIGNFQFSNNDSNSCETGVNTQFDKEKLRKFLNSDTYELITAELDFYDNQQESSITPIARETDRGSSFLQNYSQALLESQSHTNNKKSDNKQLNMFTLNLHDKTKLSQLQQSINSSNNQPDNSTKSSIYHQRKMSYQHPVPNIFHGKKSPQKAQFVFKDHYQKLASKKKASPHHVNLSQATSQVSHQNSSIKIGINSSMVKPQQKSNAGSIRTSQAVSPVAQNHQNQINLTQQYQQVQNSMNSSQIKNSKQLSQYQHCSSAATIQINGQKSNQDLKQQILLQATKHFQNQLLNKNSSSMIQNPTQSNIKSQSQIHIVQQNNHERQFKEIKSEKISPQQLSKDRQQPPHKMVANVQIDLLKGQVVSVNNQSNHTQQMQNMGSNMNHINHPQIPKHHHKPSNSISNTNLFNINNSNCGVNIQNSQSLQNSFIKRKDSFVQQSYHQPNISTTRQSSPNHVNPLINNVNQPQFNYEQTHNDKNKINKSSVMMQQHRHSVQNSPQKIQSLFQKSQKQSLHMKNASTSNIHFQAKNNQTVLSPSNKSGSLSLIKITSNNKSSNLIDLSEDGGECGRSSLIFSGGNVNKQRGTDVNYQQNKIQINEFEQRQSLMGPSILNQKEISETEQLLNQIRNNIMIQKGYKIQEITPLQQQTQIPQKQAIKEVKKDNYMQKQVNNKLAKITEGSLEQIHMETLVDQNSMRFVTPNDTSKYSQRCQNNDDSQLFNNYLQTDPNMSPYSKDVNKLKKMITFNFKKYNEPPATTSEFYRIGRVLGRGAFGKVNLAAHKISEQLVAIKSINKEFLKSEEDQRRKIMQEFAILKQSNHTSVVRLFDSFETNKHICFVMELCSGGDLLTYVRKRRKLKEDIAKYFFKQIIEGLAYIHHSKLIVHRDIKLDNILLDANGRIKICDFGVSKQVSSETERMTEQCGTPAYIAPEILKDKGYDGFKVDVWSAGVCLYAMLIGTVPFKASSMHELHHLIINGKYEIKDTKLSEHAINLIEQLLQVDPRKRLSAYEVLSHPWLKDAEDEMDIFTQKEKDTIKKEYLTKNIERVKSSNHIQATNQDTEVIFTEHNLDTKTNGNSLLKNASTKSIILAPFNSTVSDYDEEEKFEWPQCIKQMIVPKRCLKFAPKCKDLDRQYEQNNNADLDNGVYNNFMNENEENKSKDEDKDEEDNKSAQNSQDSLEKSFKETELSSDDEKAEIQVEEARKQKLQSQSELQEFEKQIKMKYVKYQEPVEAVNMKIVEQISYQGLYPKDYLLKVLEQKEMNYATATYHLLLKKKQLILKFNQNGGDHSEFIHDQFE